MVHDRYHLKYFDVVNVPRPSERTQTVFPGLHTFATGDYEQVNWSAPKIQIRNNSTFTP